MTSNSLYLPSIFLIEFFKIGKGYFRIFSLRVICTIKPKPARWPEEYKWQLKIDPCKALSKNTREGGKRSAMVTTAKQSVPVIKPN